ncbi:MAG TPA: FG-GAP-like repeat-containing protein [Candidatus Acidoferrum sp.]|nr:FG-GAP-like repeat-containing protein [Candidatus Acidoferrum sp.]
MPRGIEAILRKVPAGFDEFVTEKYQDHVAVFLRDWNLQLLQSPQNTAALEKIISTDFFGESPKARVWRPVYEGPTIQVWKGQFASAAILRRNDFLAEWRSSVSAFSKIITAEFQVTSIQSAPEPGSAPAQAHLLETVVRFELVGAGQGFNREQRVGNWQMSWRLSASAELKLRSWKVLEETRSRSAAPVFIDVTKNAIGGNRSYASQLLHGTDYWRTVLDGASGIDIYGHNGMSVADIDGDGFDDLYVCQPAGLPNRLFRNRGDGTFEDITERSGLGVLENTACALFADFDNSGRQDVIVVRANGPLLFRNLGGGKFRAKPGAFHFENPPRGTFTGAAIADYDRDGWLDIYFCLYAFYQGTDQYRYPMPYYDAENGPGNFLMRNNRNGTFADVTKQSGLDQNNTRFSFCCAWGDYKGDQWPDLYVVNDFGRKNLYRANGDGTFTDVAREAEVEDVGAGMSGCWSDFDNDGRQDLYVADMWTAAGLRVSRQENFQHESSTAIRDLYRKHAMGNSLFQNSGSGSFADVAARSGTAMGRWAWSSEAWDFDHDGFLDLYIANGMISGEVREDLNSFFWRQVVGNSPREPKPNHEYEQGWNAINELIRSGGTWSGFERNVFYLNNRDGTFSDVSGIVGLDCVEDSRTFVLSDFDHDGRQEMALKNRNTPQLRFFKNVIPDLAPAIAFRLTGNKSNRDAIGACITVETESGRQSRWLQAGSGFLAQHSKELFFGVGKANKAVRATIRWPSGLQQKLVDLPLNHRVWVEEGLPPSRTEPFVKSSGSPTEALGDFSTPGVLPAATESWLLAPVQAPDFSLSSKDGRLESLSARRGKPVLICFFSASAPGPQDQLKQLENLYSQWERDGFQLLVVDVDAAQGSDEKRYQTRFTQNFSILQATQDVISIYNLLFRSLFDRRRDLSLPTAFLVDEAGDIVKTYQRIVESEHFAEDFKNIPRTDSERIAKALPFPGADTGYSFGRNYLSLGSVFFERGYPEASETFFRRALKDDPMSAEALYGLGSVYLQQQKLKEARESFERALKLQASYPGTIPNAWNNLGLLSAREGNTAAAIEFFQRALQIDPAHLIALLNLGNAYRQRKDWGEAKKALQRAFDIGPDDPEVNYSLGMVCAQLEETDRAYEYLKRAVSLRPVYPEALNNLGVLYLRTRRPEEAIHSFEESIRVAPEYDQAYLNLARVYAIQSQREKARQVLLELLKQHPDHAQAKAELSQLAQ